jgi:hypothetical protein
MLRTLLERNPMLIQEWRRQQTPLSAPLRELVHQHQHASQVESSATPTNLMRHLCSQPIQPLLESGEWPVTRLLETVAPVLGARDEHLSSNMLIDNMIRLVRTEFDAQPGEPWRQVSAWTEVARFVRDPVKATDIKSICERAGQLNPKHRSELIETLADVVPTRWKEAGPEIGGVWGASQRTTYFNPDKARNDLDALLGQLSPYCGRERLLVCLVRTVRRHGIGNSPSVRAHLVYWAVRFSQEAASEEAKVLREHAAKLLEPVSGASNRDGRAPVVGFVGLSDPYAVQAPPIHAARPRRSWLGRLLGGHR